MAPADAAPLAIEVVYCPRPGEADRSLLALPAGATLADALHASGVLQRHGLAEGEVVPGIWCAARDPATPLRDQDRVEIYRALKVDPKEARRLRYKGKRAAATAATAAKGGSR